MLGARTPTTIPVMHPKSLGNIFSPLLLLLPVFFPVGGSFSFDFPSFNQSTPTLLNLGGDASCDRVIRLTKKIGSLKPSTGSVVYPKPLRLWDPATRTLPDFTTHFSFKFADTCSCPGDVLSFFLSPYPYTPDHPKSRVAAVEIGTSRGNGDPSNCHVEIDIKSINSPARANCNGGITSGGASNAAVSYSSATRSLTVLVGYVDREDDPSRVEKVSLSRVVDLRDILPNEVAVGFYAAAGDSSSVQTHELLSWNLSSTLLDPALPASAPLAQPINGTRAYVADEKVNSKLNLLTGLAGANLGAVMAVIGTGSLAFVYKLAKAVKRGRDERGGRGRCRCRCRRGPDDSSSKADGLESPSPGSSPPPPHSKAVDPSLMKALVRSVRVAVREEFQSRFPSTSPAVAHSRHGRLVDKHPHQHPPRKGAVLAEHAEALASDLSQDSQKGDLDLEGDQTEAIDPIAEHNPDDPSLFDPAHNSAAAGHKEGRRARRARRDAGGARRRSERVVGKGILDWLYRKLFGSENLGCV